MTKVKAVWSLTVICNEHGIFGEQCDCPDFVKQDMWSLYLSNRTEPCGCVQQFNRDGPYYGTWDKAGGTGRTGAMSKLDDCKKKVEAAVMETGNGS